MYKFCVLLFAALSLLQNANGQTNTFPPSGAAGIGTTAPHSSALLEIKSTNKGILIPRMTQVKRDGIAAPAAGLLIYQTNNTPGFYYYSGSGWLPLAGGSGGGTETDPQVGVIANDGVPRWDGTALITGAILDNGKYMGVGISPSSRYRMLSRTSTYGEVEFIGKAAVRGESNGYSGLSNRIYATGFLGVKNPSGIYSDQFNGFPDGSLAHLGVLGVKEVDTVQGAGVYGWNRGGASYNYGVGGTVTSSTGISYGVYGKAIGSGSYNFGLFGKGEDAAANYGVYGSVITKAGQYGYGVYGIASGSGTNYGGYFSGAVYVSNSGEAITVSGTNPYIQMKSSSKEVGYLRANGNNLEVSTNSGNTGSLILRTQSVNRLYINSSGRVSINTSVAPAMLNISGTDETVNINGSNPYLQINNNNALTGYIRASGSNFQIATNAENDAGKLEFRTNGSSRMWIDADGNVSVGKTGKIATGYLFNVVGKIMAEEIRVELNGSWPDYVFDKNYKLMHLADLRKYIAENHHLPHIPAASEMKDGIEVGKMNTLLMQKVEELTLYVLQLHEEIEALKTKTNN